MSEPTTEPGGVVGPAHSGVPAWAPLLHTGALLGQDVWLERKVFELLGRWSATAEIPSLTVHLGAQSRRHGWHSQLWFDRLPELSVVDVDDAVRSPGAGTTALFETIDSLAAQPASLRLAVHNRVLLPALIVRYRGRLRTTSPVADASLQRWLGIVIADDLDEWAEGEALLADLLGRDEQAAVAAAQLEVAAALFDAAHLSA